MKKVNNRVHPETLDGHLGLRAVDGQQGDASGFFRKKMVHF